MTKIVAFLDLLGFSEYCRTDTMGAARLLETQVSTLKTKLADQDQFPPEQYKNKKCGRLATQHAISSFEHFLPFSDSIFIVASDANLFVQQISTFLIEAFLLHGYAYGDPENPAKPENQPVSVFSMSGQSVENQNWFPALWRGGVTVGEVNIAQLPLITDGHTSNGPIAFGPAVVEAVGLEKLGKGPRLFCGKAFKRRLIKSNRRLIAECKESDGGEILWPMLVFGESNNPQAEMASFLDLFLPARTLWLSKIGTIVEPHYWEFMRLVIRSAFQWARTVNAPSEVFDYIKAKTKEHILAEQASQLLSERLAIE